MAMFKKPKYVNIYNVDLDVTTKIMVKGFDDRNVRSVNFLVSLRSLDNLVKKYGTDDGWCYEDGVYVLKVSFYI